MKLLIACLIAIIAVVAWSKFQKDEAPDPVAAMQTVFDEFPHERVTPDAFNVEKTDSLVNPIVGHINFSYSVLNLRAVFHWQKDHWQFARLLNLYDGSDYLATPGGREMLTVDGVRPFFEKCGLSAAR